MTVAGFIELTGGDDGLPILIARAEIAMIRQAGQVIDDTKTMVFLRSGMVVPVSTEFKTVIERLKCSTQELTE